MYDSCLTKVEKVLYKKVQKASETRDVDFYAFSFYYDLAVDLGLIGLLSTPILKCKLINESMQMLKYRSKADPTITYVSHT